MSADTCDVPTAPPMVGEVDVLVVLRAPLEQYPPSLNQVELLAKSGLRVAVVDTHHPDFPEFHFTCRDNVLRFHAGKHVQSFKERPPNPLIRMIRSQLFRKRTHSLIRRLRPKVVIAYDPNGMEAVGKVWAWRQPPMLVWHFHELFVIVAATGFFTRRALRFSAQNADRPNRIVFPDRHRAEFFRNEIGATFEPLIVMNCPPRLAELPNDTLRQYISHLGVPSEAPIVYYQGGISSNRCLEAIIQSMSHWPTEAVLVLVGAVTDHYRAKLLSLASSIGVKDRVVLVGAVAYEKLAGLTVGATLGMSILLETSENHPNFQNLRLAAGASNKRFEYMAVGVPQISNRGPGMEEIIEQTGSGALVDPTDSADIGRTVSRLLADKELMRSMSINARLAHSTRFCLEEQCRTWLEVIKNACCSSKTTAQ